MTVSARESEAPRSSTAPPVQSPSSSSAPASPAALLRRARSSSATLSPADVLALQRAVGNRAVGALLGKSPPSPSVQRYPYINSDPPNQLDAIIYGIYEQDGTTGALTLVYVGQTTDARIGTRFVEHVDNDAGAPWYGMTMGANEATWAYVPRTIESLKNVTKFETTAAEQWWYEYHSNAGAALVNANRPMRKATFNSYKDIVGNYAAGNIGVGVSWKPAT